MPASRKTWEQRFWPKVDKQDNGCWIWTAARDGDGYGVFQYEGKAHRAYRFLWEKLKGKVPKRLCVSHKCNVRPCVNPDHLRLESHALNMAYKMESGRHNPAYHAAVNPWVRLVRKPLAERFWSKIEKTDTCWIWKSSLNKDGYGNLGIGNNNFRSHRIAWELTNGPIPPKMNVLHHCDVRACCNPSHLYLGTQKENRRDADLRGKTNLPKGSAHPNAKLTEAQVIEIRSTWKPWVYTARMLSAKYGVKKSVIVDILNGKTWKHILPVDSI